MSLPIVIALVFVFGVGSALAVAPSASIDPGPVAVYRSAQVSGTVNPEDNNTFYSFEYSTDGVSWSGFAFESPFSGEVAANAGATKVSGELSGLTPGTQYFVRLAVVNFVDAFPEGAEIFSAEPNATFTTEPVALPGVSIAAPSAVTGVSAHFSGEVSPGAPAGNPPEFDVNWRFECTPECPGLEGGTIPADSSTHPVEADATKLLYNTSYEVKLFVSNAGGETSVSQTFKTEAIAPEVESRPVGTFSDTTALIGGLVDANGAETSYWLEYADNEAFTGAVSVPATKDAAAGSKQKPVTVSRLLTGLAPNSAYYFRLTAKSTVATVVSAVQAFHTRSPESASSCTNETLRGENNSTGLPDCRAYELVTPDSQHTALYGPAGLSAPDGNAMVYQTLDAPRYAKAASVFNLVRATRDANSGWSGVALSAQPPAPMTVFAASTTLNIAGNLLSTYEVSDQPLTSGPVPTGQNGFVKRPDGSFRLVTNVGNPLIPFLDSYVGTGVVWGNFDYSNVYIQPQVPQFPSNPQIESNTYAWSEERGLRLVGILPNGTPAPNGARLASGMLQPASEDGKYVVFFSEGTLYLRINDAQTVPLGPESGAGVTPDGSKVMFTSQEELTSDANTGESGGVPNHAGRDLYTYDTATGQYKDLTVDTNPADAATGANVQYVLGGSSDGSSVYFVATGALASGASPGHSSLYAWRDDHIEFVADEAGLVRDFHTNLPSFGVTPDGERASFISRESLTGYDNVDPATGESHSEVFEFTLGSGVVCVSCRSDGDPPTGDSRLPRYSGMEAGAFIRVMSADGGRVFFESDDAVVPGMARGLSHVFEYENGRISPISPLDGSSPAFFVDSSASGDDVFFATSDELVSNPNGGDDAVYDARVDGGFPVRSRQECSGVSCRGLLGSAPTFGAPASTSSSDVGNVTHPVVKAKPKTAAQIRAAKLARALKACRKKARKKRSSCEKRARKSYRRSK